MTDANNSIAGLTDPFDIIFVDIEFSAYRPIVEQILDQGLLTERGIILVDNGEQNNACVPLSSFSLQSPGHVNELIKLYIVFARGFIVESQNTANIDAARIGHWIEAGEIVRNFNSFVATDPRITVSMLPFFDGISEIRLAS